MSDKKAAAPEVKRPQKEDYPKGAVSGQEMRFMIGNVLRNQIALERKLMALGTMMASRFNEENIKEAKSSIITPKIIK